MSFDTNVFINCPVDEDYKLLLKPIIFTIIYCGFHVKISETLDSGESRVKGIEKLIEESRYSIHDLSRMAASEPGELARFNMPFELGLDLGCKRYRGGEHANKRALILDIEKYRYQKALSDLSGNDIAFHDYNPENAVREVRNWFKKIRNEIKISSANQIWIDYNTFTGAFMVIMHQQHFSVRDITNMPWNEYITFITEWIEGRRTES